MWSSDTLECTKAFRCTTIQRPELKREAAKHELAPETKQPNWVSDMTYLPVANKVITVSDDRAYVPSPKPAVEHRHD